MKIKKLFIILLAVASLISLLTIAVSASQADIQISEDYSTLTYKGEEFILVDTESKYGVETDGYTTSIDLTAAQGNEIALIEAYTSDKFVELYIEFNKGGNASYIYVHKNLLAEFNDFTKNGGDEYSISLFYDAVTTTPDKLFGKAITIKGYELSYYFYEDSVYESGLNGTVEYLWSSGYIFGDGEGNVYYFDYDLSPSDKNIAPAMNKTLTVWQITDTELLAEITDNSFEDVYGDYDGDFDTEGVPLVLSIIIFTLFVGIVPLAGAIVCLVLSFRATAPYKKYLRIAAALLAATALVALITVILIIVLA